MKVGIVGSRKRDSEKDKSIIREYLNQLYITEIVSGGCKKGADKFAEELSEELNVPIKIFNPDLSNTNSYYESISRYYDRNKKIAEYCDILIALVSTDRKGGTENTIKYAKKLNKSIIIL